MSTTTVTNIGRFTAFVILLTSTLNALKTSFGFILTFSPMPHSSLTVPLSSTAWNMNTSHGSLSSLSSSSSCWKLRCSSKEEEDDDDNDGNTRNPSGAATNNDDKIQGPTTRAPLLQSGISGFALDPRLGFVCVLSPADSEDETDGHEDGENDSDDTKDTDRRRYQENFTYVTVSPTDTDKLSSAESLCLIQLAGGLDLGAAIFPPESLANLVRNELLLELEEQEQEEEEDSEQEMEKDERGISKLSSLDMIPNVQELRSKVTLLGVTALPNEAFIIQNEGENEDDRLEDDARNPSLKINVDNPERNIAIQKNSPKILTAVQNLPGLTRVTLEQVIQAMQIHADENGQLNQRESFSELLDMLRTGKGGYGGASRRRWESPRIRFRLTASLVDDDDDDNGSKGGKLRLINVDQVPPFQALALSLRYKVPVTVSKDCFQESNIQAKFPAFKPMRELAQDARVMDGLISSMFFKESSSSPEDDNTSNQ